MPFACQILRGTTGTCPGCDQDSNIAPPQVTAATAAKRPELPKLRTLEANSSRLPSRAGRRGLL